MSTELKRKARLSPFEFHGLPEVPDPVTFIEKALSQGIGPAKAFGCGLLFVAQVACYSCPTECRTGDIKCVLPLV
ncbi:MAG: type I-E CRISPR-associated protein Cas6/Cse3/CasE [Gammaproteobacteria bacterium]